MVRLDGEKVSPLVIVMVCVVPEAAVGDAFGEGLGDGLGAGLGVGLGVGDGAGRGAGDEAAVARGDDGATVGFAAALGVDVTVAWEAAGDADRAAAVAAGETGVAALGLVLAAGVAGAVVASAVTGAARCALDPPQAAAAVSTAATVSSRQCTRMGADWPRPPAVAMGHWS
jgi:hypothetical protein